MPAIRIEEIAFGDDRYEDLAEFAKLADADHARGKMARLWRQCTLEGVYELDARTIDRVLGVGGSDALVRARLGELQSDGRVRIRGTAGRIEWLDKLRENGKFGELGTHHGSKGGRPKRNPLVGVIDNPPSASALLFSASATEESDRRSPVDAEAASPSASSAVRRKSKPKVDATDEEIASVARVLAKLGEWNGVTYTACDAHTRLIVRHLRNNVTELDLRKVIAFCGEKWEGDDRMKQYLRPETLFGPETIAKYLDAARTKFAKVPGSGFVFGGTVPPAEIAEHRAAFADDGAGGET